MTIRHPFAAIALALTTLTALPAVVAVAAEPTSSSAAPTVANLAKPTPIQIGFQEAEIGVIFHFDPRIVTTSKNRIWPYLKDREAAKKFRPDQLDTDQWIATAKSMGATFAIMVAKHDHGFCLWQSDANPFCMKYLPWRDGQADIVGDFVASCRKHGVRPGIFTCTRTDKILKASKYKVEKDSKITQEQFTELIANEFTELCTRYGKLFMVWFDGGAISPEMGGPDLLGIVQKHQPEVVFYHNPQRADARWGGAEMGTVPYPCWATLDHSAARHFSLTIKEYQNGDSNSTNWYPAMATVPLRCEKKGHDWGWVEGRDDSVATLAHLKNIYLGSVGRNATLMVGLGPNRSGVMANADVKRCKEFGDWLHQTFGGKPLAETAGKGQELTLEIPADNPTPVRYLVLQENIKEGERVREYVVEAEIDGAWQRVGGGSCIGHKRIQPIKPCVARKFRLRITQSIAEPDIRSFGLR